MGMHQFKVSGLNSVHLICNSYFIVKTHWTRSWNTNRKLSVRYSNHLPWTDAFPSLFYFLFAQFFQDLISILLVEILFFFYFIYIARCGQTRRILMSGTSAVLLWLASLCWLVTTATCIIVVNCWKYKVFTTSHCLCILLFQSSYQFMIRFCEFNFVSRIIQKAINVSPYIILVLPLIKLYVSAQSFTSLKLWIIKVNDCMKLYGTVTLRCEIIL